MERWCFDQIRDAALSNRTLIAPASASKAVQSGAQLFEFYWNPQLFLTRNATAAKQPPPRVTPNPTPTLDISESKESKKKDQSMKTIHIPKRHLPIDSPRVTSALILQHFSNFSPAKVNWPHQLNLQVYSTHNSIRRFIPPTTAGAWNLKALPSAKLVSENQMENICVNSNCNFASNAHNRTTHLHSPHHFPSTNKSRWN